MPSETTLRLTASQIASIRHAAWTVLGPQVSIRLFGSRVRSDLKGGDIDLLFETEQAGGQPGAGHLQHPGPIVRTPGDREIDIPLKVPHTPDAPIFEIAKRTGVIL